MIYRWAKLIGTYCIPHTRPLSDQERNTIASFLWPSWWPAGCLEYDHRVLFACGDPGYDCEHECEGAPPRAWRLDWQTAFCIKKRELKIAHWMEHGKLVRALEVELSHLLSIYARAGTQPNDLNGALVDETELGVSIDEWLEQATIPGSDRAGTVGTALAARTLAIQGIAASLLGSPLHELRR